MCCESDVLEYAVGSRGQLAAGGAALACTMDAARTEIDRHTEQASKQATILMEIDTYVCMYKEGLIPTVRRVLAKPSPESVRCGRGTLLFEGKVYLDCPILLM